MKIEKANKRDKRFEKSKYVKFRDNTALHFRNPSKKSKKRLKKTPE